MIGGYIHARFLVDGSQGRQDSSLADEKDSYAISSRLGRIISTSLHSSFLPTIKG